MTTVSLSHALLCSPVPSESKLESKSTLKSQTGNTTIWQPPCDVYMSIFQLHLFFQLSCPSFRFHVNIPEWCFMSVLQYNSYIIKQLYWLFPPTFRYNPRVVSVRLLYGHGLVRFRHKHYLPRFRK